MQERDEGQKYRSASMVHLVVRSPILRQVVVWLFARVWDLENSEFEEIR